MGSFVLSFDLMYICMLTFVHVSIKNLNQFNQSILLLQIVGHIGLAFYHPDLSIQTEG